MYLFSENSYNNILRIKEQCETSLLKELNVKLGSSYHEYSPLMCSIGKWNDFHEEDLFRIFPLQKNVKCITDLNLLNKLEKIFTSEDSYLPLDYIVDKENTRVSFSSKNFHKENEFVNLIYTATDIIKDSDSFLFKLYERMISYIFPIFPLKGANLFTAFSTYRMMDSIFISPNNYSSQYQEIDYSIHLIHELGHQVLYVWQTYDPLILNSQNTIAYSALRKSYRPALASLHSAVALAFMLKLCYSIDNLDNLTSEQKIYIRNRINIFLVDLKSNIKSIIDNCTLTKIGGGIILEICELIDE
ncbi:hypothetical protein [Fluviispira vulneris]|uniref:hypothetical protein n=1 Tax=Fluviispira vulneris TaxID=2763012 RepID=UPI001645AD35|nr:hypothetical protein [Fluviispira vulneris]